MKRDKSLFWQDEHGYWIWSHFDFMTGVEANALADSKYPECHVGTYAEYLKRCDPDTLSERTMCKVHGLPYTFTGHPNYKTMAITGKLDGITRRAAIKIAESRGWYVVSRITESTSLVICGTGGGRKARDAQRFGISVMSWKAFMT